MQTPYFDSLIDDFGIWQHTDGTHILREHGYSLDDAARGVIACLAFDKVKLARVLLHYIEQSYKDGHLYGFAHEDHSFFNYPASADATGQAVWALGYAAHLDINSSAAKALIKKLNPALDDMTYIRGSAYALLGALYLDGSLAAKLLTRLQSFFVNTTDEWPWPEDTMTYGNGVLPYAFLRHAIVTGNKDSAQFGRRLLKFVQAKCQEGRILGPIGNEGWLPEGAAIAASYSQQPIDAAYMIWAWLAAYQLSNDTADLAQARRWWQWFEGKNIAKQRMYEPGSLKAYDGIESGRINDNSGAESNICLVLSMKLLETKQTV